MEAQDLIKKLEARGITLTLEGLTLRRISDKPIPKAIVTTIKAHQPALRRYLKAKQTDTIPAPPENMRADIPKAPRVTDLPKQLEYLRDLLNSGQLDGRPLKVLDNLHPDVGAVVRERFGHLDNAEAEGLHPGFFAERLREILTALEREAAA